MEINERVVGQVPSFHLDYSSRHSVGFRQPVVEIVPQATKGRLYVLGGYGGYTSVSPKDGKSKDPLKPAISAYNAGHYKDAEKAASEIIRRDGESDKPEGTIPGAPDGRGQH